MRVGDAFAEIWREGRKYSYCCAISSVLKRGRWKYHWSVDRYDRADDEAEAEEFAGSTATTWAAAYRAAMRAADFWERTGKANG